MVVATPLCMQVTFRRRTPPPHRFEQPVHDPYARLYSGQACDPHERHDEGGACPGSSMRHLEYGTVSPLEVRHRTARNCAPEGATPAGVQSTVHGPHGSVAQANESHDTILHASDATGAGWGATTSVKAAK